jgi:hypothetical protein
LKWLFDDSIANSKFTPREDKTAHATTPLQRVLSPTTDRRLHSRAGIARSFDEDAYGSETETLPQQLVQSDTAHDDLASACPWGYGSSEETPHLLQDFGFDQGELSSPIPARPPVPFQAMVGLNRCPLDGFCGAITLAYDVN